MDGIAGTTRGTFWKNIQFGNNAGTYSADFVHIFRSVFEDCAFHPGSDYDGSVAATLGAVRVSGNAGGVRFTRCAFGGDSNIKGFGITFDGEVANMCVIEDCLIGGVTACVRINSATCATGGTVFKDNHVGTGFGSLATALIGFDDNTTDGFARYDNNTVYATAAFDLVSNDYRALDNSTISNTTAAKVYLGT